MIYIYDILLNFNTSLIEFFEWEENDLIKYIKKIMLNMPISIDSLYFPLFYPLENKIMSFKAIRNNSEVVILKDNIKVI